MKQKNQMKSKLEATCEVLGIDTEFYPIFIQLLDSESKLSRRELLKRDEQIIVDHAFVIEFRNELDELNRNASRLEERFARLNDARQRGYFLHQRNGYNYQRSGV